MAGHVDCEICLEPYDSIKKIPKFLQCYHTICIECLKRLHDNGSITCPSCRKQTIVEDLSALQTNFYLATQDREIATVNGPEGAVPEKDSLYWCGGCAKIVKKCNNDSHDIYGLSTALGREMMESHLKTNELTCRLQWETSLGKHEEFARTLAAITQALQSMLREVGAVEKKNQKKTTKIKHHLQELTESTSKQGKGEKLSESNLVTRCQKFDSLAAESKRNIQDISALSLAISSIRNALVSLDVQTEGKGKLAVPLFDGTKVGFENDGSVSSDWRTVLSYLILSSTEEGKIFQLERENVAALKKKETVEATTATNPAKDAEPKKNVAPSKKVVPPNKNGPPTRNSMKPNEQNAVGKAKAKTAKPSGPQPKANQPPNKPNFNPNQRPPVQQVNQMNPLSNLMENPQAAMETMLRALAVASTRPPLDLAGKKCFMEVSVNGNLYGRIEIELRADVAPKMCQRFAQACEGKHGQSYHNTIIMKRQPMSYIAGGRINGYPEYVADVSPLKRGRGAVFLRLKQDIEQVKCPIVCSDFIIQLNDDKRETRSTTVFGFVSSGLAICDAVSHLDPMKDHISLSKVGIF